MDAPGQPHSGEIAPVSAPLETYDSLSALLEQVLLRPNLSSDDVYDGCRVAREYGLPAIVVRPCDVESAVRWLGGSDVQVVGAVNYPYGYSTTAAKLYEGRDILRLGASELEFTINSAHLVSRQFQHVETELMQIVRSCQESGRRTRVLLNSRFLADDLKIIATKICKRVGADTISIDYRESDLALFRPLLKDVLTLKCAGPVDTVADALAMRAAGFRRIGTTAAAGILDEWRKQLQPEPAPASPS